MAQDTTPAIICYQGDGSNSVFDVPFDKGYYGEIKVLFVRRGLADYTYNPNTFTVSGRLYAWQNGGAKIYTHTPNPAIGAPTYNSSDVEQAETVSAIAGQTITVDSLVYSRAVQHDISSNMKLTWTGDMLEVGDFICIVRNTERGQPYEMPNNQKHIERALDNIERQVQEVKDATDNALKIDPSHDIPDSHKMNPIDWLHSIIRCMDFSVRAVRLANGWFDYSTDDPNIADADKTWVHLLNTENIKNIREQSYIVDGVTYYRTQYMASDGTWKTLSDLSKWDNMKLTDLKDTNIVNPTAGHFLMFDGLKWKNTVSSGTVGWGAILGTITDQTDLMNKFSEYVKTDGSSTMTNPLMMRATEDFKCAIAPYWDGVGFFRLNDNNSVTLMASIEYNSGFEPATTNTYNIGASARKWKNLYLSGKAYVSVINNGYDLAIPAKSGTLATKEEVDLAANSGRMITDQGVWFAKMYAASTVPTGAEYDGKNYADFSQVDSDNNPVIKIYTGASGAWTLTETITPPADYDGYVSITSKIWDIVEQAGQQGGRILWNHQSKEFTPYPQIISFENAALTGNSTTQMPVTPTNDTIINKGYLDAILAGLDIPEIFDYKWKDCLTSRTTWALSDGNWISNKADAYAQLLSEWTDDMYALYIQAGGTTYNRYSGFDSADWFAFDAGGSTISYATSKNPAVNDYGALSYYNSSTTWASITSVDASGIHLQKSGTSVDLDGLFVRTPAEDMGTLFAWKSTNYIAFTNKETVTTSDAAMFAADNGFVKQITNTMSVPTEESETVNGVTIQFHRAANGHKICRDTWDTTISNLYTATGVAWYYIIDTANQQFKLPRVNPDKKKVLSNPPVNFAATDTITAQGANIPTWKLTSDGSAPTVSHVLAAISTTGQNVFAGNNNINNGGAVLSNAYADTDNATMYYAGEQYLYFYVGQ